MDTAGRAVLFAGTTVVIALLGMMLLGVDFLYGVAISASIGVLLVMLGSLTLLPALLTFAGARLATSRQPAQDRAAGAQRKGTPEPAAPRRLPGHRTPAAGVAAVERLRGAPPPSGRDPLRADHARDRRSRGRAAARLKRRQQRSHEHHHLPAPTALLAEGFGEGFNGPLQVVVKLPHRDDASALRELQGALASAHGVVSVTPPRLNPTGEVATFSVYPSSSPQAYATTVLVRDLREHVIPPVAARTGAVAYVGGVTAGGVDFATVLAHKLPLFIGVVVLLSALLLMVVFRSLVIPLQAAVMNLLSIGASLGRDRGRSSSGAGCRGCWGSARARSSRSSR